MMTYTWNLAKNRQNTTRHGIAFEDAARIFEGPRLSKWTTGLTMARSAYTPSALLTASRSRSFISVFLEMSAESFRRGGQSDMKEKRTGRSRSEEHTSELQSLRHL